MTTPIDATAAMLEKFLAAFGKTSAEVGVIGLLVFLEISKKPGTNFTELSEKFSDIPRSTIQRQVALLKDGYVNRGSLQKGADLVEEEPDPQDRRVKILRLTARGSRILAELTK